MLSISNNVPSLQSTEAWHEIVAAPEVTFSILVRTPTLADTLGELGAISRSMDDPFGAQAIHRIRASVIDWRDVTNDPTEEGATAKPIRFSFEMFATVLMKYPPAMRQVTNIVYDSWSGETEESEKN